MDVAVEGVLRIHAFLHLKNATSAEARGEEVVVWVGDLLEVVLDGFGWVF